MLTEKEKMLQGLAHQPYENELTTLRQANRERLFDYNYVLRPSQKAEKQALLQQILGKADETTKINSPFHCDYGRFIEVGKHFYANANCIILDNGGVTIGDNVMFGPNVSLYTVNHPLDPSLRAEGWETAKPIVIGNNVWVCGSIVILGGVTIGDNVVIAAGSVVTKDIPANSLAMGNPCRVVRAITEQDRLDYQARYFDDSLS
ncbi:galactoside O-acetyltransferase [Pasteurellaceae bacterium RH1A]|nr:galactoside O-acetyltransferase [Pasteurellaceae bacterium RH1A]